MKNFKFKGTLGEETVEFKEFINNLKNEKKIDKIKIVFEMGAEATMTDVQDTFQKFNDIIPETADVEFGQIVDERLDKNTIIIKIDIEN